MDAFPFLAQRPQRLADAHVHFYDDANADVIVDAAERFGIGRLMVSCLGSPPMSYSPSIESCHESNGVVCRAMKRHPAVTGYAYVNPCFEGRALAEFRARIEEDGFSGLKLWVACYCDDPRVFPLVEQAIDYAVPILIHTWSKAGGSLPNESEAPHVARLASRYPESKILMAHMSGDWLVRLRQIAPYPNVHVDTSGIDPETGQIERAVELLGAQRVIYGSDAPIRDLGSQIAKVLGAEIDPETREQILWGNLERLLAGVKR